MTAKISQEQIEYNWAHCKHVGAGRDKTVRELRPLTRCVSDMLEIPSSRDNITYLPGWGDYDSQLKEYEQVVADRKSIIERAAIEDQAVPLKMRIRAIRAMCAMTNTDLIWYEGNLYANDAHYYGMEKTKRTIRILSDALYAYSVSSIKKEIMGHGGTIRSRDVMSEAWEAEMMQEQLHRAKRHPALSECCSLLPYHYRYEPL